MTAASQAPAAGQEPLCQKHPGRRPEEGTRAGGQPESAAAQRRLLWASQPARLTAWEHDQGLLDEAGGSFVGLAELRLREVLLLAQKEIGQRDGEGKVRELQQVPVTLGRKGGAAPSPSESLAEPEAQHLSELELPVPPSGTLTETDPAPVWGSHKPAARPQGRLHPASEPPGVPRYRQPEKASAWHST